MLGLLIAVLLGVGQVNSYSNDLAKHAVEQDADADTSESADLVMVSTVDALASSVLSLISHVFYFISENIVSEQADIASVYLEKPYLETYLNTIFRQIISPNAP